LGPKRMRTLLTASDCEPSEVLDWRPVLLAGAAWLGTGVGTSGISWLGWVVAAGSGAALIAGWLRRRWLLIAAAGVAVVLLGLAGVRVWFGGQGPVAELASQGAVVAVEATAAAGRIVDGGPGGAIWLVQLDLRRLDGRGAAWDSGAKVLLSATGDRREAWRQVPAGAMVRASVKLAVADDNSISAWASARSAPVVIAEPGIVDAAVTSVRTGLRNSVDTLPEGPRALVPALVVGDTENMPAELVSQFKVTGLTHVTAVSGANLTLMLAAILWLAGRIGVLGWWRRGLAVVGVAGFVLLCRGEPSVLRAAAMGLVGLIALGLAGPRQGLRYLSWGMIALLVIDPWLSRSIGFALSVLASGGIIMWARRWSTVLSRWLPGWLAEAVTVPVAAQLATQPVVTAISGQVSVVGLVTNLVAAPLVGPGTVFGFAAAWSSVPFPPLAKVLGWCAGGFAQGLCWIAAAGSSLPGASATWPANPVGIGLLTVACAAIIAGLPAFFARPWLVVVVTLALVAACLRPFSPPGWPPTEWSVVACDVGQGDATVIRAGPSAAIVVDAGPQARAVDQCLDQLGITTVPWLVFTHPHADHIGGVAGVISGRKVQRLLLPDTNTAAPGWNQVRAATSGVPITMGGAGTVVSAGSVQITVLALRQLTGVTATEGESAEENDSSVLLSVQVGGIRLLLAGDLQQTGQTDAMASAAALESDVLLVPHHGSASQSAAFLGAVSPTIALISVGADNSYGHPAARTLSAVSGTGAKIFRTDQAGAIAVGRDVSGLTVATQRT
jgi:competence protein ComEC